MTFLLLENKTFPAGLIVVSGGAITGLMLGAGTRLSADDIGFNVPEMFPFPFTEKADFVFVLFALVLPPASHISYLS